MLARLLLLIYRRIMSHPPKIFDSRARARLRARAVAHYGDFAFLKEAMAEEIAARIATLERHFALALDLGSHDGRLAARLPADHVVRTDLVSAFAPAPLGVLCHEDRLPFADASFDLIVSAASLGGVDDLPRALVDIRRALKPGGYFFAAFIGGESLPEYRMALLGAESDVRGGVSARIAPTVSAEHAPALLQRAGFVDPVADLETHRVRYDDIHALWRDLRGSGEGNYLAARPRTPMPRALVREAAARFAAHADADGRVAVQVQILHLAGRAPAMP